jgi:hypothetical protein
MGAGLLNKRLAELMKEFTDLGDVNDENALEYAKRLQPAYRKLDWKWAYTDIPNVEDLHNNLRSLMVAARQHGNAASGGMRVYRSDVILAVLILQVSKRLAELIPPNDKPNEAHKPAGGNGQ